MRRTLWGLSPPVPVMEECRIRRKGRLSGEPRPDNFGSEWGDDDVADRVMGLWVLLPHVSLSFLRDDRSVDVHHHAIESVREVTRAERERLIGE